MPGGLSVGVDTIVAMLSRLGLPDMSRHKALVTGLGIDALGSGVFMPVSILYFLTTTDVGKREIGLALSICGILAVPFVLAAGSLVDRFGAKRLLLAANILEGIGFLSYPFVDGFAGIVIAGTVTSLGQSAFWASFSPLVAAATPEGEREIWFGFLGALRNVGFAVGGLAAGVVVSIGTVRAFDALAWVNAASYAAAFLALRRIPAGEAAPSESAAGPEVRGLSGWARVLGDRRYLALVLVSACYAFGTMSLVIVMPVYAIDVLGLPGWVSGALFTVNTVLVGFLQSLVVRRMDGRTRHRVITAGLLMYAAGFTLLAGCGLLPTAPAVVGVLGAVVVYTFGEILAGPPLSAAAVDAAPAQVRGRYLAAYQMSWTISGILAPALFLGLLDHDRYSAWGVLLLLVLSGVALLVPVARRVPAVRAVITSAETTSAETINTEPAVA